VTLREQLKLELDSVDDATIAIVHQILMLLKKSENIPLKNTVNWLENNPLKNSIVSEADIVSPIDEVADLRKLAAEVYEGLTEEEIDEVEAISCHRSDW
jgi:hypothetical protein